MCSDNSETGSESTLMPRFEEPDPPYPCLQVDLSDDELRETAYEIFVAACALAGKNNVGYGVRTELSPQGSPDKSVTSAAVKRFKKVLSLRSKKKGSNMDLSEMDIMRLQMQISEKEDARIRRALTKAMNVQVGKSLKLPVVPVELLQHTSTSEFSDFRSYKRWQHRQLKVLQACLLFHGHIDITELGSLAVTIFQAISNINDSPYDGKNHETFHALRNAALAIAGEECHWADGFPFNVHIYVCLLRSFFDSLEENVFIDEVDELLQLIKKTWWILGIDKVIHKGCFIWALFRQFIVTGQTESELLRGAEMEIREVGRFLEVDQNHGSVSFLTSVLKYILVWAEKRMLKYYTHFPCHSGWKCVMEGVISLSINAGQVLHEYAPEDYVSWSEGEFDEASTRICMYIQSSIKSAFDKMKEVRYLEHRNESSALVELANQTAGLAAHEKENYSSILKQWHPYPLSVAAATLHSCYRAEITSFLAGFEELTTETMQVLRSAAKLERNLLQMDIEDKTAFEDCRPAKIPAMVPFTLDVDIGSPLKKWVHEKLDRLREWLDRNVEQERWIPKLTRDNYALSVVEVLRIIEETLDAFFSLPVSQHPELLEDLVIGVDCAIDYYISLTLVDCGRKEDFIPDRSISRRKEFNFLNKVSDLLQKNESFPLSKIKVWPQVNETSQVEHFNPLTLQQICVRVNTVDHIQLELEFLEKRIRYGWQEVPFAKASEVFKLKRTKTSCQEAIRKLCDIASYKVVFWDLRSVFWQGLYVPSIARSRVGQVIEQLNQHLEVIAGIISGHLRDTVVNYLMMACFEGFLQIIIDVSSMQSLNPNEIQMLQEDFTALKDLFKADGEGLPENVVEDASDPIEQFLISLQIGTDESSSSKLMNLETHFRMFLGKSKAVSSKTGIQNAGPKPMSSELGYRCHALASKFVKKTYDFYKK